ncbi:amidohydrolase family protein [soil metagenome]
MFPVIDSHQHIWDPARAEYDWLTSDLAPIDRAIGMEEALPLLRAAGVERTILVQSADNDDDTALMREAADAHDEIVGIVGFAPLDDADAVEHTIASWSGDSRMVGIRNLIHNKRDPDWLLRDDVMAGLRVLQDAELTFDVVAVLPRHLELVPLLSERLPHLRMVVDHLGKPPIGMSSRDPWWRLIAEAAANPNVYGKVSGLYAGEGDSSSWTPDTVRPFFDRALEVFGADRLMFGGDWPISVLSGGYERLFGGLSEIFSSCDEESRERLLGRTAAEFYRIDPMRLAISRE